MCAVPKQRQSAVDISATRTSDGGNMKTEASTNEDTRHRRSKELRGVRVLHALVHGVPVPRLAMAREMRLANVVRDGSHEDRTRSGNSDLGDRVVLVVNPSPRHRAHHNQDDQHPLKVDPFVQARLQQAPDHQCVRVHDVARGHARVAADGLRGTVRDGGRQRPLADLLGDRLVDQREAAGDAETEEWEEACLAMHDAALEGPDRPPDRDDEGEVAVGQGEQLNGALHGQADGDLADGDLAGQLALLPELLLLGREILEALLLILARALVQDALPMAGLHFPRAVKVAIQKPLALGHGCAGGPRAGGLPPNASIRAVRH
mmetsp:Transcript_14840/g.40735  ORF Transcript_14840/g.40735 Transcript_14840/m.40735 type:complete len:319 (+) Transcript_14840:206-1162(+)